MGSGTPLLQQYCQPMASKSGATQRRRNGGSESRTNKLLSPLVVNLCPVCFDYIIDTQEFFFHLESHEHVENFRCANCHFRTSKRIDLYNHMAECHQSLIQVCVHCEYVCDEIGSLMRHLVDHCRLWPCEHCLYEASSAISLHKHMYTEHNVSRGHRCTLCSYGSSTYAGLTEHMIGHTDPELPVKCPCCGLRSAEPNAIISHLWNDHFGR